MRNPPKNKASSAHHTVPKFYLKGFKEDDGHIMVWHRKDGKIYQKALKYASTSPGYYTVLDKDKNESDMIENFYSSIESNAKPVFDKMTCIFPQVPVYGSEERTAMSIFLATQFTRTKQSRRKAQLLHDYIYKLHKIISLANQKTPLSQKQINFINNPHEMGELVEPQDIFIRSELESSSELIPLFYCRQWTIVSFSESKLITSDSPIVLLPRKDRPPVGLANAPEYWFPLDSRHLLILSEPLCPYPFMPSSVIDYSTIEDDYCGHASLYDIANSLQLQNCCMEAYGERELLKKYEGFSLPTRKPFTTGRNTKLDSYYACDNLNWEPTLGHKIRPIDF